MTESTPDAISLALYFDQAATLDEMRQTLDDIHDGYQECLTALDPPPGGQPLSSPQITIRTGSLYVELTSALESGAWGAGALVLLKMLIANRDQLVELAALPLDVVSRIDQQIEDLRERWADRRLRRQQPKVDDAARQAIADREASTSGPSRPEPAPSRSVSNASLSHAEATSAFGAQPPWEFISGSSFGAIRAALYSSSDYLGKVQPSLGYIADQLEEFPPYLVQLLGLDPACVPDEIRKIATAEERIRDAIALLAPPVDWLNDKANKL